MSGDRPDVNLATMTPKGRSIRRSRSVRAVMQGNTRRLVHGIFAVKSVAPEVADEAAMMLARGNGWLDPIRDGVIVEETARILVRLRRLDRVLDAEPTTERIKLYVALSGHLLRYATELGLTPRSYTALGLDLLDARERTRRLTEQTLAQYAPSGEPSQDADGAEP